MNKVKIFLLIAALSLFAYGQSGKFDKLKEGRTDESVTAGKFDRLREGISGSATGGNPKVLSQSVDSASAVFIQAMDTGFDYLKNGRHSDIVTHVSGNGEVSVCYATNTTASVFEYSKDLQFIKAMEFESEWSLEEQRRLLFGREDNNYVIVKGSRCVFTKDNDGNFYFFYARTVGDTQKDVENMAIVKYDRSGRKLNTFRLNAGGLGNDGYGTKSPTPRRIEISGNKLGVYFGKTAFIGSDGSNHQSSAGFVIDKDSFTLLNKNLPLVSHSFNQFLLPIEGGFMYADDCDRNPCRGFVINGRCALRVKQGSSYQITFVQLGGLAETQGGYILAGAYEKNNVVSALHNDSRNLLVLTMGSGASNISEPIWITNYTDKTKENVASPKIVGLNNGRVLLMWEVIGYSGYKSAYMTIIDKTGNRLTDIKEMPGVRLNVDDVLRYHEASGNVYWAVNGPDMDINIYSFNPDNPINITARSGAPIDGYGLVMLDFKSEKTSVQQNEVFTVSALLTNPLFEDIPAGMVGAALVDDNGRIVEIIGTKDVTELRAVDYQMSNSTETGSGSVGSSVQSVRTVTINNAFVPERVRPGKYKLRIVYKPSNRDWRIVSQTERGIVSDNANAVNAIPFAVMAERESAVELTLNRFRPAKTENVLQNEEFNVSYQLKDIAPNAFSGDIGVALTDNAGNIVAVIGSENRAALSTSSRNITCSVPRTVREGQYNLRIAVKTEGENWKIVTKANVSEGVRNSHLFNVIAAEAIVYDYGLLLESFAIKGYLIPGVFGASSDEELTSIPAGQKFIIGYRLTYTMDNLGPGFGDVGIVLVDNANNIVAFIYTRSNSLSAAIHQQIIPVNVPPGQYKLKVAIKPEGKEWRIVQRTAPGVVNSIPITVTAAAQLAGLWGLP